MKHAKILLVIGLLAILFLSGCDNIANYKLNIISDTQCNNNAECIGIFESAGISVLDGSLVKCNNNRMCEVKDSYIPQGEEII